MSEQPRPTSATPPSEPIGGSGADPDQVARWRRRVAAEFPALRRDLETLVRIPSISSPSFDQADVRVTAHTIATLLSEAGMPEVEILSATGPDGRPGSPAVLARRPAAPGQPTVVLYAHHDVQPVGDLALWDTPPFEPIERDGRLYGRGAADDKAGVVAHLGALRVLGDELGIGVTVFVEGEEEIGSPTFSDFLHAHRDKLAADVFVVADSANWRVGVPALTTSLRGLVGVDVEVAVLSHAVHSGFFGGPVLDAVTLLSRLIATLHDDKGNVAVAGLVVGPDPVVDYDDAEFRADSAVLDGVQLAGSGSITARLWTRPALSVIGIDAPSIAESSNTVVPRATARLSMRLAPGQDPAQALAALGDHLLSRAPFGAQVSVRNGEAGKPFQSPLDSVAMRAARTAFAQAWGVPPVDIGVGGSIPFIADLVELFPEAAILVTGVEDPDSRAHSANESVHLGDLENAVLAEVLLLASLVRD